MRNPILETKLFVMALCAMVYPELVRYMVVADFFLYAALCIMKDVSAKYDETFEDDM